MKCPHCGADVPASDLFCGECGTRIVPEEKPTPTPTEEPKRGLPLGLLIGCGGLLAVVVIAACIFGAVTLLKETPTPTEKATRRPTKTSTPTATFTSTPTLTATPTDTPTATPTPTATEKPIDTPAHTPTPTPSPTGPLSVPTPSPDLSRAVLTEEDFPSGFSEMSPEEMGISPEDLSQENFTIESMFVFFSEQQLEFVMGFTALVPSEAEQAGFDIILNQPDILLALFISGMGTVDILEQEELTGLDDIGDSAAGVTVVANMQGIPMRIDLVVFRRDIVGAFAFVMYLEGSDPEVLIGDVGRKLDARIQSVIAHPLYFDDFGDPTSGWTEESDENGAWGYRDGVFFITITAANWLKWDYTDQTYDDFTLQVDAQQTMGADDNEYGVLFRYVDADNFYSFDVAGDGSFAVFKNENDEWITLVDWQESAYINPIGQLNRLKVICQGDQIAVYANDQELASLTDDSFSQGDIGLFAGTFDEPPIEAIFDNLRVTGNP